MLQLWAGKVAPRRWLPGERRVVSGELTTSDPLPLEIRSAARAVQTRGDVLEGDPQIKCHLSAEMLAKIEPVIKIAAE